jgi:glycerophosphoryl diester phosphodiesterase
MKKLWIGCIFPAVVFGLAACQLSSIGPEVTKPQNSALVIAHRAGGGQWPQNSRTAVLNCIERAQAGAPENRIDGLEMDIVLTRDGIPVLSHDPWVHTTLCTTASGEPIRGRVLIRDKTLEELQSQYLCGGVRDPHFPRVEPKAETIMTLEEVLQTLKKAPHMLLYLDIKIDGDLTAGAEDYAQAISRLWEAAGLPNRLYIEGPSAESLAAYRSAIKADFVPVLSYPAFSVKENSARTAVRARWLTRLRLDSPWTAARNAQAGAVVGPTQVIFRFAATEARDNGVQVVLFTINTREDLERYCGWPVDVLITDYPDLGHCPGAD